MSSFYFGTGTGGDIIIGAVLTAEASFDLDANIATVLTMNLDDETLTAGLADTFTADLGGDKLTIEG